MSQVIKAPGKRLIAAKIEEKIRHGMLIMPDHGETFKATIMAVGEGVSSNIQIGDICLLKRLSGFPFKALGIELLSIVEQEIIAIVPDENVPEESMNGIS
jgi:co-chaperonin GroES (HSP10)